MAWCLIKYRIRLHGVELILLILAEGQLYLTVPCTCMLMVSLSKAQHRNSYAK
jgi:hypothetical protein